MGPPRIAMRRATVDDQKAVTALITKAGGSSKYRKRYGAFSAAFLEFSLLAIIAYDADDDKAPLLGFASFSDSPREPTTLEDWASAANDALGQTWRAGQVLFVSFLVADPAPMTEQRTVEKLLTTAFATLPLAQFAVASLPVKEPVPAECGRHFQSVTGPLYGERGVELPGGAVGGAKGGEQVGGVQRAAQLVFAWVYMV
jgi:hypothetical protein